MLVERIDRTAAAAPDRIAVVAGGERLSYRDLRRRSLRLGAGLARAGVGPGAVVGVVLPRTPAPLVALAGVLRAGAAYTMLEYDGADPDAVVRRKLAAADAVVTTAERAAALAGLPGRILIYEDLLAAEPTTALAAPAPADRPAYVLFTSGSTGPAKGVVVDHGNLRHYTESLLTRLGIGEPLAYAHVSTLSADLGNTCLFLPLWSGGTVHLVADHDRRDPRRLMDYLRTASIDVVKTTPSHWGAVSAVVESGRRPSLRYLLLGGEALAPRTAREILRSGVTRTLVNHYGPTETTVGVAVNVLRSEGDTAGPAGESVPIGTGLGQTRLLVRTDDGTWHEKAATGELHIAGPSVSQGYLGLPEENAKAFLHDPEHGRLYRTGDLIRLSDYGEATFLGRVDRQVKIGGYRVELEYVETVLRAVPGVRQASCHRVAVPGRHDILAAAVVADSDAVLAGLGAALRETLPDYMVPRRFTALAELPRTDNGKTDAVRVREILAAELAAGERVPLPADEVDGIVAELFAKYLGRADFAPGDDFFDLGGDSVGAIQVVADLQRRGHEVTTGRFLAEPTARALSRQVADAAAGGPRGPGEPGELGAAPGGAGAPGIPPRDRPSSSEGIGLAPSQAWFLGRGFAQPDAWNQALCCEVDGPVDAEALRDSVAELVGLHPMLRTAFRAAGERWVAEAVDVSGGWFSTSVLDARDADEAGLGVQHTMRGLQAGIDPEAGRVFRVHLFTSDAGPSRLLMLGHHLAVDAVSWRILIDDLRALYGARLAGGPAPGPEATGFWQWLRASGAAREAPVTRRSAGTANVEGSASSAWLVFSEAETEQLVRDLPVPLHAALLGVFARELGRRRAVDRVPVDVETHGRRTGPDQPDVSRTVGWFTALHRLDVPCGADAVQAAAALLDGLGDHAAAPPPVPDTAVACYNFLGRFDFPLDGPLPLRPSSLPLGPVRGPRNDRVYDLKVTARIVGGRLGIDLSFSDALEDATSMAALLTSIRDALPVAGTARVWIEPGSSTGLLTHVPECPPQLAVASRRAYRHVLITGATGYIGAHLLHRILTGSTLHASCLVRAAHDRAAEARLWDTLAWYFPDEDLQRHRHRVTALAGDIGEPSFGLPVSAYRALAADTDAVYHLAADTRLVSRRETMRRANTDSVREAIRLCSTARPKDLHYMSTLAVCGYVPGPVAVPFAETDLDIGQRFLSEYEESKFQSELLVRRFAAAGGSAFVYRTGNVTGHSATGRFQRNGGDNRLVQLLRALVKLGRVPGGGDQTVVLSPVDTVADAVFALSTAPGGSGGVFHVDAARGVPYRAVFDALRDLGFDLRPTPHEGVDDLVRAHADVDDPELALAYVWAGREDRNVSYRCAATHRRLDRLGVRFTDLDRAWLGRFCKHLIDTGVLTQRHPHFIP
ncbi:AMP-binding protein [Catenulispora subtropica]|uniref:Carrier domain-containing protein n=1 Tax=Catenulispora subtropica TaxID=450798 RepID=A0ABN2TB05_9ACTN